MAIAIAFMVAVIAIAIWLFALDNAGHVHRWLKELGMPPRFHGPWCVCVIRAPFGIQILHQAYSQASAGRWRHRHRHEFLVTLSLLPRDEVDRRNMDTWLSREFWNLVDQVMPFIDGFDLSKYSMNIISIPDTTLEILCSLTDELIAESQDLSNRIRVLRRRMDNPYDSH